jgi:phosphopantothenoylcysteine decarboxylase / phosphopantothenate---cysteine ligase
MDRQMLPLESKEILLVVGGGIAAYKAATLAREFGRLGASVETVLTEAAQRFISGVTFAGLTGRPARVDLWDPSYPGELHIELTRRAHMIVVAPATADLLARMAHGLANDLATTCFVAAGCPIAVAPAMHPRMWNNPATRANIDTLISRGVHIIGPTSGPLASGESGIGRMVEPEAIAAKVTTALCSTRDLGGMRVLVTAGPTYEPLDPVRFVGNRSSGRMGYAIAEAARDRGATVTLVTGPVALAAPTEIDVVRVQTAIEMQNAVISRSENHDVVVMAAAVADYRPAEVAQEKIKKSHDTLSIQLVKNPDILAQLGANRHGGSRPVLVGFAVETGDLVAHARGKLARKGCDMVVANLAQDGFEGSDNRVTLVTSERAEPLPKMSKRDVAERILDTVRDIVRLKV